MSGRVLVRGSVRHECAPGWRDEWSDGDDFGSRPGWYGVPPSPREFPPGTVWQCECGRTWVSLPTIPGSPGVCRWRRERHLGRWWREQKAARAGNGSEEER